MLRFGRQTPIHRGTSRLVEIKNLRAIVEGRTSRVCADVDGDPLWFESGDAPLQPAPEAFGCAALPVAVEHHADVVLDAPLDAVWNTHIQAIQETWRQWWRIRRARIYPRAEHKQPFAKAKGVALCFSSGVDSFYSLLRGGYAFDHLVFVQGYDVKLSDTARAQAAERSLREVAAVVGAKAVMLRTNLREHPTFRTADWERTHGGALAALGHLLGRTIGILVISASYPYYLDTPWGSHWKIDPLWSSSQVEIAHAGAWLWRKEKLEALAGEDLVRQHLRVCWQSGGSEVNCGFCEKCVRTMLILALAGQLEHFPIFGGSAPLAERINRLPSLVPTYFPNYEQFFRESKDPQVAEALCGLLRRSRATVPGLRGRTCRLAQRFQGLIRRRGCEGRAVDTHPERIGIPAVEPAKVA
ncbi:MAG: hypothetical protein M1376_20030 [Planctomycetes bacterium]|nr:hypothetical protein [Planctomycetota bacterium]